LLLATLFLRWRAAAVCIVVVPVSFVLAGLVLDLVGTTMNAIVLAGLVAALALVIDDAVVTVDNVSARLREHRLAEGRRWAAAVVVEAVLEVRRPALYAALVVALAGVPFFFAKGLAGAFFPDLVGAFLLAVLASLVVALVLTPTLCLLFLGRTPK